MFLHHLIDTGYGVAPGLAPEPFGNKTLLLFKLFCCRPNQYKTYILAIYKVMGDEAGYGVAPAAADGLAGLLGSDSDSEDDIESNIELFQFQSTTKFIYINHN